MSLNKNLKLGANALLATGLLTASAFAADVTYTCTGVAATDTPGLNAALQTAGADGTVTVDGDCVTNDLILMNWPRQTLQGPGSIYRLANAAAPAPQKPTSAIALQAFVLPGPVIRDSSGSVIQDLDITSEAGNAITASGTVTVLPVAPWFTLSATQQPDDIVIRRNRLASAQLTFGAARCVQQFAENAGPTNDINRVTGAPGALPTGWEIYENECDAPQLGLLLSGDRNRVENNVIRAGIQGIAAQNNFIFSSGLPGNANNIIRHNVIQVDGINFVAATLLGIGNAGLTAPFTAAGVPIFVEGPNHRAWGNLIEKNCISINTQGPPVFPVFGNGRSINQQFMRDSIVSKNDVTARLRDQVLTGVTGIHTFDTRGDVYEKNDLGGTGDLTMLAFYNTSAGNQFSNNDVSELPTNIVTGGVLFAPMMHPPTGMIAINIGADPARPNVFSGNHFCDGDLYNWTGGGLPNTSTGPLPGNGQFTDNLDGHYCHGEPGRLRQSSSCFQGHGYAPLKAGTEIHAGVQLLDLDQPMPLWTETHGQDDSAAALLVNPAVAGSRATTRRR